MTRAVIFTLVYGVLSLWSPLTHAGCDPDGTYILVKPAQLSYQCGSGFFSVTINQLTFSQGGSMAQGAPQLTVDLNGAATSCPSGSFDLSASIGGTCMETHRLNGSFFGSNSWSAQYSISFSGFCLDCQNQVFDLSAERPDENIFRDGFESSGTPSS